MFSTVKTARWSVITIFIVSLVYLFSANIYHSAFITDKNFDKLNTNTFFAGNKNDPFLLSKLHVNEPGIIETFILFLQDQVV